MNKKNWEHTTLRKVLDIKHGKDYKGVENKHSLYPVYGSGEQIVAYVDEYICEAGTIILGRKGTIDKPRYIEHKYWNIDTAFSLVPKEGYLAKYIYYHCLSVDWKSLNSGAAKPSLTQSLIYKQTIRIPKFLSEQQKIVDYLDNAFEKIDQLKKNAEQQLSEAKALFQASLKSLLEPKDGWEEKTLGEVGTFIRGGNFAKADFVEDGFPCIHYGQIHTKFGVATYKHLSCVPKSMVKKERCVAKGDLAIAITSEDNEGSCKCTAWMADYEAYVGGHAAIFKHTLNPLYVSYYFKSPTFQKAKIAYTHGFKVVEINPKDIAKIPIFCPSDTVQQSIVVTLNTIHSKINQLQSNYDKICKECDALKQAILREVFE